jgi:hypothetical protein
MSVRRYRVAALVTAAALAAAGCSVPSGTASAPRGQASGHPAGRASAPPAPSGAATPAPSGSASPAPAQPAGNARWPGQLLLRESGREAAAQQVADPASDALFMLVPSGPATGGSWRLRRVDLRTGQVLQGQAFPVSSLVLAGGYLWVYGTAGRAALPVVSQVRPATLTLVRSIDLAAQPARQGRPGPGVAAGPAGSAWVGVDRTLLRVSLSTGQTLARATLPAGLAVDSMSADAAHGVLYAGATRLANGEPAGGGAIFEYSALTGAQLASDTGGLVTDSVAGPALTAVPGGVWVSFRTGMLGITYHLASAGLRMIAPPGPGVALGPPGIFHWPMGSSSAYGGALWLTNDAGILGCVDQQAGSVMASERLAQSQLLSQFAGVDQAAHVILAVGNRGLLQITPPRRCWS